MIKKLNKKEYLLITELGMLSNKNFKLDTIFDNEDIYSYYEEELCGFIQVMFVNDILEIINIAVDENQRRKGIGKKLIDFVTQAYKPKEIILEVNENNDAKLFYKKLGFIEVRTIKNYYGDENAISMKKVM